MDCKGNSTELFQDFADSVPIVKASVMGLLLLISVIGNITFMLKTHHEDQKWIASDWFLQSLGLCGLVNGLLNISVHLSSLVTGTWLLGNIGCQLFGILSSILMAGWIWLLTIAMLERYKFLMSSSDHTSLFSEVNTRIIYWGIILLLSVIYLGPIYGWGEYSYLKGKLDLTISLQNYTLSSSSMYLIPEKEIKLKPIQGMFYGYLQGNSTEESLIMREIKYVFRSNPDIVMRAHRYTEGGVVLPLRIFTMETLQCLWRSYTSRDLHNSLTRVLTNNATLNALQLDHLQINVWINLDEYTIYRDIYHTYQRSLTCGLDYSPVNRNVHTFIAFSWLCTKFIPLVLVMYFCIRIFCWNRDKAILQTYSYVNGVSDQVLRTKVVAYTTFIVLFSASLHDGFQLAAGFGIHMSGLALFMSTIAMYSSWCVMPLFYLCTQHFACCGKMDCCYYWCCMCCCSCTSRHHSREWAMNTNGSRGHDKPSSRVEPNVRTRLLTVSRTNTDGSTVISDRDSIRLSRTSDNETCL